MQPDTGLTPIEVVRDQNLSLTERAGLVEVVDADTADEAGRMLVEVKRVIKQIDEARTEITKPLDLAKSRAMEQAKGAKKPFEEAKEHLDGAILGWQIKERERIRAEQAVAEAEQARLESEAMRAAERGEYDEAARLQQQRDTTGTVEKAHRAAGTQTRFTWKGEVTDLECLVRAVANSNGMLPANLLEVNQSALNAYAKATAGKGKIPGVRFYEDATLAATDR